MATSRSLGQLVVDHPPVDPDLACGGLLEPRDHSHGGGLAAARGAEQDQELLVADLERLVVDRDKVAPPLVRLRSEIEASAARSLDILSRVDLPERRRAQTARPVEQVSESGSCVKVRTCDGYDVPGRLAPGRSAEHALSVRGGSLASRRFAHRRETRAESSHRSHRHALHEVLLDDERQHEHRDHDDDSRRGEQVPQIRPPPPGQREPHGEGPPPCWW